MEEEYQGYLIQLSHRGDLGSYSVYVYTINEDKSNTYISKDYGLSNRDYAISSGKRMIDEYVSSLKDSNE